MTEILYLLKALADETRLNILNLLLKNDLCVGAIASRLEITKAAVSQHLQVLRKAGLVRGEKRGYWTHYAVKREKLRELSSEIANMADFVPQSWGTCLRISVTNQNVGERRKRDMCKCCCEHPEKLKGKPEDCTPEQIKECHGDAKEHSCITRKEE